MKNIFLPVAIALIAFFAFSACHKSSSGSLHGSMTATINGQPFTSSHCVIGSFYPSATGIKGLNITGWIGNNFDAPDISLSIANYTTGSTGAYTIVNDTTYSVFASVDSTNSSGQLALTGTINIKSSSATAISGTFSFTLFDGTTVTNGLFTAVDH